jgi:nicotinamide mononucleotide adenylyltransferase
VSEKIIIGIGSSNVTDEKNPYPFKLRKKILQEFLKNEKIESRVLSIIAVVDHPDDDVWLSKLLKKIGKVDVVIGDNEWVNQLFEKVNVPAIRIGFLDRKRLEGKVIRLLIHQKKKWKDRVPKYLIKYVTDK